MVVLLGSECYELCLILTAEKQSPSHRPVFNFFWISGAGPPSASASSQYIRNFNCCWRLDLPGGCFTRITHSLYEEFVAELARHSGNDGSIRPSPRADAGEFLPVDSVQPGSKTERGAISIRAAFTSEPGKRRGSGDVNAWRFHGRLNHTGGSYRRSELCDVGERRTGSPEKRGEISNVSSKSNHATTVLSGSSLPVLKTSIYEVFLQQLMAVIT